MTIDFFFPVKKEIKLTLSDAFQLQFVLKFKIFLIISNFKAALSTKLYLMLIEPNWSLS